MEWQTVTRRNRVNINRINSSSNRFSYKSTGEVGTKENTIADIIARINKLKRDIQPLDYITQLIAVFQQKSIICYGLGSIEESTNAQYQLASLLFAPSSSTIQVYDPVFTAVDKAILAHFQIAVLPDNEIGKRTISSPTIFYMPHCTIQLYHNVLLSNWNIKSMTNLTIVGNSFHNYDHTILSETKRQHCLILSILPHVSEIDIPIPASPSAIYQAFHSTSIHTFPNMTPAILSSITLVDYQETIDESPTSESSTLLNPVDKLVKDFEIINIVDSAGSSMGPSIRSNFTNSSIEVKAIDPAIELGNVTSAIELKNVDSAIELGNVDSAIDSAAISAIDSESIFNSDFRPIKEATTESSTNLSNERN